MLNEKDAIDLARRTAQQQGWAWVELARAALRRPWFGKGGAWEVGSNAGGRGAMARFVIDVETGAVLDKGNIPR